MLKIRIDPKRCRDRPYSRLEKEWIFTSLLELDSQKQSVALLQSVKSEKYGCKDLIKIEGLTEPERLDSPWLFKRWQITLDRDP